MVSLTNSHNSFEKIFHSFFRQGEVTEIRALGLTGKSPFWEGWAKGTVSGYFDNLIEFAKAAESLDKLKKATGIYFVLNPVNPALLARGNNRLVVPKNTTTDEQVVCHRWLLIDADPVRPSGISATDQEILLATNRINKITAFLQENSFPEPIKCNSGNGAHAIYRLPDLPNSQETTKLKAQALQALQHKFGSKTVDIDLKVFNPSRITKLYGTWARKGDNIPDRSHRQSFIEHIPEPLHTVSLEQLKWLASLAPKEEAPSPVQPRVQPSNNSLGRMDVEAYLSHYSIETVKTKQRAGATLYCLKHCVFDPEHTHNESAIVQDNDGKLLYQCFHNSCQGKTWHEARQAISGADSLGQFCNGYEPGKLNKYEPSNVNLADTVDEPEENEVSEWNKARELFPRLPFPWNVLPEEIAESLKQLARSCASSPLSLHGAAISIFSSTLGSTIKIKPKRSWPEPLIFWFGDIRPSGEGKSPGPELLKGYLGEVQKLTDKVYRKQLEEELTKKPKDRRLPPRAKSYFVTNLTLEGLTADCSGNGGIVYLADELSSFISAQNQYKSKGDDRESWLKIWSGYDARIIRKAESFSVNGQRVNMHGGIQPSVWRKIFGGTDSMYLNDGTVFRFLVTYEGYHFREHTKESWSNSNRNVWKRLLKNAMEWSDDLISVEDWKPKSICLSENAQDLFFNWSNKLEKVKLSLPEQLRGYIPKLQAYSLRLAGALYCVTCFSQDSLPGLILNRNDMQKGIDAVNFYMGHIVDAMQALCTNETVVPFEITDQVKHLATTMESLRNKIESSRLAIGYIQERFNELASDEQKIKTPHAMGALLRKCGLTIPAGHFRANKKIKVKCLLWDKKTDSFLKQVHKVLFVHNSTNHAGLEARTLKNQSPQSPQNTNGDIKTVDKEDIKKSMSSLARLRTSSDVDKEDIEDIVSKENKKTELEADFEEGVI